MPRNRINCDPYVFDALVFDRYNNGATNSVELRKKLNFVYKAMKSELSPYQFQCLKSYFVDGRRIKDIAADRGVHPSTISRTIKRAKNKLAQIASYY